MHGRCLCGAVRYQLDVDSVNAYQCHCSLCRMQSGTSSNLGALVSAEKFAWISGQQNISCWVKDTGFTSAFCTTCGAPVPNELQRMGCYWIPVGTLEDASHVAIIAHICVASKAGWDYVVAHIPTYAEFPDRTEFPKLIN